MERWRVVVVQDFSFRVGLVGSIGSIGSSVPTTIITSNGCVSRALHNLDLGSVPLHILLVQDGNRLG